MPVTIRMCKSNVQGRLTTHMQGVGEEVARVCYQEDETALDLWVSSNMRQLEQQTCCNADYNANEKTDTEDDQEDSNRLEQV